MSEYQKDVSIKIGVIGDGGQALANVDKQLNNTAQKTMPNLSGSTKQARYAMMNFNRVVQDAPFGFIAIQNNIDPLVQSFQSLKAETGSTKMALKTLMSSFAGPAGFLSIISLAVSGITAYMMATRGAKKEVKALDAELKVIKSSLKEVYEITGTKKDKSIIDIGDVEKTLGAAKRLRDKYAGDIPSDIKYLPGEEGDQKRLEAIRNNLTETLSLTKSQREEREQSVKILDEFISQLEEANQKEKLQLEIQKLVNETLSKRSTIIGNIETRGLDPRGMYYKSGTAIEKMGGVGAKNYDFVNPAPDVSVSIEEVRKEFAALSVVADAFVDTFRSNFLSAWEDVFGKANSLFEQLLQNVGMGLLSLVSGSVSNSIFGFIGSMLEIPVPSGGKTQTVIVQMGQDNLAKGVYKVQASVNQKYQKIYAR
uniref:Putative structural protein n=1 Tax=viral metagenome TaxID=1070528 RepID=A0A6M3ILR9_9ZZZZ